jgi:hypothetical protein
LPAGRQASALASEPSLVSTEQNRTSSPLKKKAASSREWPVERGADALIEFFRERDDLQELLNGLGTVTRSDILSRGSSSPVSPFGRGQQRVLVKDHGSRTKNDELSSSPVKLDKEHLKAFIYFGHGNLSRIQEDLRRIGIKVAQSTLSRIINSDP